jgi:hypothetical protein
MLVAAPDIAPRDRLSAAFCLIHAKNQLAARKSTLASAGANRSMTAMFPELATRRSKAARGTAPKEFWNISEVRLTIVNAAHM